MFEIHRGKFLYKFDVPYYDSHTVVMFSEILQHWEGDEWSSPQIVYAPLEILIVGPFLV